MKRKKSNKLTFFFYNGCLHKKIHIQRSTDVITAFQYKDGHLHTYVYSDVKKNGKRAYGTGEVCKFINRSEVSIWNAIKSGEVHTPERVYGLDENRNAQKYMWSEENIWELHDYFSGKHIGRPRKDGRITNGFGLPNRTELRAMLRTGMVLGYQDSEGNFIPTWEAENL